MRRNAARLRAVDIRLLIPELFEKLSLIATAGLLGVLVPPLRNRLLGVGQPRDIAVVIIFGLMFSLWGSVMGVEWLGHHLNLRTIGIMIAGILGGPRAGAVTGFLGGGFYVTRVDPEAFPWALIASVLDGWLAGRMSVRRERMFVGWRVLGAAALVQLAGLTVTGFGMAFSGANPLDALPSLVAQVHEPPPGGDVHSYFNMVQAFHEVSVTSGPTAVTPLTRID
jgi:hypothetical protein